MSITQPTRSDSNIYLEGGYYHKSRWMTYYIQYQSLFNAKVSTVLEIGPGGGITTSVLRQHGVQVTTLDLDAQIKPDVVGNVTKLPFADNTFDAVVGFEILEHLPFEQFTVALKEMSRVSKKHVFISLPDHARSLFYGTFKIPFFKEINIQIRIPAINNKKYWAPCGHHWESGNRDYPVSKITKEINQSNLKVKTTYVSNSCPMTRFFLTEKSI